MTIKEDEITKDIEEAIRLLRNERFKGPYILGFQGKWYDLKKGKKLPRKLIKLMKQD